MASQFWWLLSTTVASGPSPFRVFLDGFRNEYEIQQSTFTIEGDQGSALRAIAKRSAPVIFIAHKY
jgi:hypothetical protein